MDDIIAIDQILESLRILVDRDGGRLTLVAYTNGQAFIEYAEGTNDACSTCVIDRESMTEFIREGILARNINAEIVLV